MAFWCYILRCADGRYYTGHTDNLEARVAQHQAGRGADFTARRQPVVLASAQEFPSRLEALEAERRISSWSRDKKDALIAGDWTALSYWAKPPAERPSTSLGTNGGESATYHPPHVPNMVEARETGGSDTITDNKPFVPSEVEAPAPRATTAPHAVPPTPTVKQ